MKRLINIFIIIILFLSSFSLNILEANAAYQTETKIITIDGNNPDLSKTINIPNLYSIENIQVDTGNTSGYTIDGDYLKIDVSNGAVAYKTVSDNRTKEGGYSYNPNFPSSINSNSGSYSGTLYKSGSEISNYLSGSAYDTKFVTDKTSSYYSDSSGYSGYLESYVYSGSYTPAHTKYVTDQSSSYYSNGGYNGTLTKYTKSGSYTPSDTKPVTDQPSANYNSGGYVGTLTKYVKSGSYQEEVVYNRQPMLFYTTQDRTCKEYYNDGINATGKHVYTGYNPDATIVCGYTQNFTPGNDTRVYAYQGNVTKPASDTRVYAYQGDVTKSAVDTRVYRYQGTVIRPETRNYQYSQNYSGTVYRNGITTENLYRYVVTITYVDNIPPELSLNNNNTIYSEVSGFNRIKVSGSINDRENGNSSLHYSIDSKSGRLKDNLSNGNWTEYITVDSLISNGTRELNIYAEDGKSKNSRSTTKSTTIKIDKISPVITYNLSNSNWTNSTVTISPYATDNMSGVNSLTDLFIVVDNGPYTITAVDNVGNSSSLNVNISNIDKEAPTITLTNSSYDTYSRSHNINFNVKDTRGGNLSPEIAGSGVYKNYYYWSTNSDFDFKLDKMTDIASNSAVIKTPDNVTGKYYLYVVSIDNVGNKREVKYNKVFKLDNTIDNAGDLKSESLNEGSISVYVSGEIDNESGFSSADSYSYTIKDTFGNKTESNWKPNNYIFNNTYGNELYEVSYKLRDKSLNELYNPNTNSVLTMSYNASDVRKVAITDSSLKFDIIENAKNMYGNTESGSKYKIILKDNDGNTLSTRDYNTSIKGILFNNLIPNTNYNVFVEVQNRNGIQTPNSKKFGEFYTLPSIPELDLLDVSNNSLDIKLVNNNPDYTKYLVEMSEDIEFKNPKIVSNWSDKTNLKVNDLKSGINYYFRVKVRSNQEVLNSIDYTDYSKVYNYKTVSSAPVLVSVLNNNHESEKDKADLLVRWNSTEGAEKYYVYRDGTKVGEIDSSQLTYTDYVKEYNKKFTYTVRAWNGLGNDADDVEWHDKGLSTLSNSVDRYSRSHDLLSASISNMINNYAYFDLENSSDNVTVPEYYLEVRNKKTGSVVSVSNWSSQIKNRELRNLSYGIAYELWVNVRNNDNPKLENNIFKVVDEFWMNRAPELNIYLEDTHTKKYNLGSEFLNSPLINSNGFVSKDNYAIYSNVTGYNLIKIRGELRDLDYIPTVEPLELYYTIKRENGSIVNDYNNIRLADLGDIIGDTRGNWVELKYNNNLGNYIGLSQPRFNSNLSTYANNSYKFNDYMDIPIGNLSEGKYSIEIKIIDDQGDVDTEKLKFIIDNSKSTGKLNIEDSKYNSNLIIDNVNFDIAGKDNKAYLIEVSKNNENNFKTLFNYQESNKFNHILNESAESNTKYTYRGKLLDKAGNEFTTSIVEYISSIKLKPEKGIDLLGNKVRYGTDRTNTINIEWENPLDINDGLQIEIYRSNKLINIIKEGDKYDDKNLDYERDYNYKILVVGKDKNGSRLESLPIEFKVTTGSPVLITDIPDNFEFDLNLNAYKAFRPLFTKDVKISLDVEYKQGAEAEISYLSSINKYSNKFYFTLKPNIKNRINIIAKGDDKELLDVSVLLSDINLDDGVSSRTQFVINEVVPEINSLDENLSKMLYK